MQDAGKPQTSSVCTFCGHHLCTSLVHIKVLYTQSDQLLFMAEDRIRCGRGKALAAVRPVEKCTITEKRDYDNLEMKELGSTSIKSSKLRAGWSIYDSTLAQ